MKHNEILDEIYRAREEIAAKAGGDSQQLLAWVRAKEAKARARGDEDHLVLSTGGGVPAGRRARGGSRLGAERKSDAQRECCTDLSSRIHVC